MTHGSLGVLAFTVAALFGGGMGAQAPADAPQRPEFRAGSITIPLDVRVVDKDGRPVTDLKQSDFKITENKVRQTITQFWSGGPAPVPATPVAPTEDAPLPRRGSLTVAPQPAPYRVFLILLGRGNLVGPSKGLEGVLHLVRDRLLPQDRVAIMAWNRATPLTTNHQAVVRVLERLEREQIGINAELTKYQTGLAWLYGNRNIPAFLQQRIDAVFEESGQRVRTLHPEVTAVSTQLERDLARQQDNLTAEQMVGTKALDDSGKSFDEFIADHAQTTDDTNGIFMAIDYLRQLDGEKHLVWLCEYGLYYYNADNDMRVARAAADSRVALSIIRTGGVETFNSRLMENNALSSFYSVSALRKSETSRTFAEVSGGRYDANKFPSASVSADYIENASRFQYLLGYTPSDPEFNGKYRDIKIEVARSGVTVLYRHGYFANVDMSEFDRRAELGFSRIAAAAGYGQPIPDVRVTASATRVNFNEVRVEARIDPASLQFEATDGRPTAVFGIGIFCLDDERRPVGQLLSKAQLALTPEQRAEVSKAGGAIATLNVAVKYPPETLKFVVYHYNADLVGSVNVKVKK